MSSDDFDDTVKCMLAAMFAFLLIMVIFAIGRIYIICGLRHQRRRRRAILYPLSTTGVAPTEVNLSHEPPTTGLDQSVIASLPKFGYKPSHRLGLGHGEATECSVCLSTIGEEATVRLLPNCEHLFHADCIDVWLRSHTTCPICRAMAEPRPQAKDGLLGAVVQPTAPPLEERTLDA